jgi:hypothetical protein
MKKASTSPKKSRARSKRSGRGPAPPTDDKRAWGELAASVLPFRDTHQTRSKPFLTTPTKRDSQRQRSMFPLRRPGLSGAGPPG